MSFLDYGDKFLSDLWNNIKTLSSRLKRRRIRRAIQESRRDDFQLPEVNIIPPMPPVVPPRESTTSFEAPLSPLIPSLNRPIGVSGYSGYSGIQGFSGVSGFSGYAATSSTAVYATSYYSTAGSYMPIRLYHLLYQIYYPDNNLVIL